MPTFDIEKTRHFSDWLGKLADTAGRQRINVRIQRLREGHFGDTKTVAGSIRELRIHYGPGYRVYFAIEADRVIVLLCGGGKSSQARDIVRAVKIAAERKASP